MVDTAPSFIERQQGIQISPIELLALIQKHLTLDLKIEQQMLMYKEIKQAIQNSFNEFYKTHIKPSVLSKIGVEFGKKNKHLLASLKKIGRTYGYSKCKRVFEDITLIDGVYSPSIVFEFSTTYGYTIKVKFDNATKYSPNAKELEIIHKVRSFDFIEYENKKKEFTGTTYEEKSTTK